MGSPLRSVVCAAAIAGCTFEAPSAPPASQVEDDGGSLPDAPDSVEDATVEDVGPFDLGPKVGCGNGVIDDEESCDDGADNASGPAFCNADCTGFDGSLPWVPPPVQLFGAADVTLPDGAIINTSSLTVSGSTVGRSFHFSNQTPAGPMLAVWHVNSLRLEAGARARVVGENPLVILAREIVEVAGDLSADAALGEPGPGGAAPEDGDGAGARGTSGGFGSDGGGGGAGYAGEGGSGGSARGGTGGAEYNGDLGQLLGGSGGGSGAPGGCRRSRGGAGGGGLFIYAGGRIEVIGTLGAGGGGGARGVECDRIDAAAGGGGGSGGTIALWAPVVEIAGAVVAHGGGGGGAASGIEGRSGEDGLDGTPHQDPIGGGSGSGSNGGGGTGGTSLSVAEPGGGGDNGGGGGGAVGRILVVTRDAQLDGRVSPMPSMETY